MKRREFIFTSLAAGTAFLAGRDLVFAGPADDMQKRVDDLIKQMTLEEKVQFLRGDGDFTSMGNKRLGINGISMADSPQGVRIEGPATVFPSPVAMAASWDIELIEQIGAVLGRELKAKGRDMLLGPCVNIHRSPLGGRNVESFGEDPYLSGKIAASYIRGVQSEKVAACVKHFAANNLETRRLFLDVTADLRYLHEIEFPPFRMAVEDGKAFGVMASYNQVNGHYSWANRYLLTDVLRGQWKFKGVITSDWGCEWMLPEERSAVESIDAGTNIHMPMGYYYGEPLIRLVKEGKVEESAIDKLVGQNLLVIYQLGLNYKKKIDNTIADTRAHHELARRAAAEGMVLLKNRGSILPLSEDKIKTLAVIGPNAAVAQLGDRGSVFVPTSYTVSPLEGLKNRLGSSVDIKYVEGYEIGNFRTIPASMLRTSDGKPGLLGEYFTNKDLEGKPVLTGIAGRVKFDWGADLPKEATGGKTFTARWSGKLISPQTKTIFLGIRSDGAGKLYIDDKLLIENIGTWTQKVDPAVVKYARINLKAGEAREIRVEYSRGEKTSAVELVWADVPSNPFAEAVKVAKMSDYVVIFAGLNIDCEGEGLDRFDMSLPGLQNELIEAVVNANPKTIVVINSGTPNDMARWIDSVPAVLQAWYPGMEGGNAVADVLFGVVNPSGKLPVTFGHRREDYADYPYSKVLADKIIYSEGIFVGYRHFDMQKITPLFPFGHGLSYTTFKFGKPVVNIGDRTVEVRLDITNTGMREGSEVAQLYVSDLSASLSRPPKELKAFGKVKLSPQQTRRLSFRLERDAFSFYDPNRQKWVFEPGDFEILIGASSRDIRVRQKISLR